MAIFVKFVVCGKWTIPFRCRYLLSSVFRRSQAPSASIHSVFSTVVKSNNLLENSLKNLLLMIGTRSSLMEGIKQLPWYILKMGKDLF
jgi:hypothetical protein